MPSLRSVSRPFTAATRRQTWGRLAVAAGFGAGGLLLLIGSVLAAPVFLLSALHQSQRWLTRGKEDPVDDADEPGSPSAVPFVLFILATVLVLWAAWTERLSPPSVTPPSRLRCHRVCVGGMRSLGCALYPEPQRRCCSDTRDATGARTRSVPIGPPGHPCVPRLVAHVLVRSLKRRAPSLA